MSRKKDEKDAPAPASPEVAVTVKPVPPAPTPPPQNEGLSVHKIDEKGLPEEAFPVEVARDFRVLFAEAVHDEVLKHAKETTEVELCGILVGKLKRDRQGPYLAVTGAIRGEHAQNDGAQVKLTHETWEHVHKVKDERFPQEAIVGWYHTHPGFGIFLSSMDVFIQEFFFNSASQVALVIDPRTGDEGIFLWENGKVERARRFWVGARERTCDTGPTGSRPNPARAPAPGMAAPASVPVGISPAQASKKEEEEDFLGDGFRWLSWALPYLVCLLLGYLGARYLALRDDAAHREIRGLIQDATESWGRSDELERVSAVAGVASHVLATSTDPEAARARALLEQGHRELDLLTSLEIDRKAAAIDALAVLSNSSDVARLLVAQGYLELQRHELSDLLAGGTAPAPEALALLRQHVENGLQLVPDAGDRDMLRQQFPELYPQQTTTPGSSSGTAPVDSGKK